MELINSILLFFFSNVIFMINYAESREAIAIIGGNLTKPGDIKYIVSVQFDREHRCGGGILDNIHVITAASCLIKNDQFISGKIRIVTGVNDLTEEDPKKINIDVEKAYVPYDYESSIKMRSDIAVLKLKESLNLAENKHLERLDLPRLKDRFINKNVTIAGFGWDEILLRRLDHGGLAEGGFSIGKLYFANAKVMSNKRCEENHYDNIGESELCAKIIKEKLARFYGTCRGDEGGPLVYKSKVVIGIFITSQWGCNESLDPGRYTRVSSFRNFILNAMKGITDENRVHDYTTDSIS